MSARWTTTSTAISVTDGTIHRAGDFISIVEFDATTGSTTSPTLYRVTSANHTYYDVTPIDAQQLFNEAAWFPSKWELNREAAIKGARAQEKKHQRVPKTALVARTSFQQMARLPCYRGTRSR